MLFNIPYCKSQAPVAAVAAISSLRFSSSSSPALIPPPSQPLASPSPALVEENLFAALLASDPPPPEPLRLVLAAGDVHSALRGLPGLARQLFRWAEDTPRGFPRTASAFAAVLVPLAQANHIRAAYPVSLRALHLGLLLPLVSFLLSTDISPATKSLLSLLLRLSTKFSEECEARDATPTTCSTLCLSAFREMTRHGVAPDVKDCNRVLRVLRDAARWDDICVVHAEMLQLGIEPSIVTYNTLLDSFLKEGREDKAAMVLKEMETQGIGCLPNDVTYNVVISWLTRKGEMGEAVELVDWMRLSKKASSFTYNMLITGFFAKGFLKKVEALQLVMENEGDLDEARRLKEEMVEQGCLPDVCTYTVLMNGSHKVRNLAMAREFFDEMLSKGLQPDCFAYNTRICAELALGSASKAFQLREVMMLEGISSDIVTYNILIDGLCKTGNLKDAEDLQMKMVNDDY
nr:unnamed protein product [Digitaria exilis]